MGLCPENPGLGFDPSMGTGRSPHSEASIDDCMEEGNCQKPKKETQEWVNDR
jgi:hypothetical protein